MDVESLAKQLILQNMTPEQQNAVLESVRSSLLEARNNQKRRVSENVGMVVEALKKIEADIRAKYDDLGGKIETRVNSIRDGRDGIDGRDGKDGKDGRPGRDGAAGPMGPAGRDGVNGLDGEDGVSVTDAKIDFDGSLVITLSNGREINVGEVVAPDLAERIKVITNGGGTSQAVLDALASLQTQINNLIPSQTGNAGKFLTTNGSILSWADVAGGLDYQGTWNASTNTPSLASGVGTNGYYYVVSVDGSTNLDGITDWKAGDWLLFNGTVWQKIDQSWAIAGANDNITSMTGITGGISSPDFIQFDTGATVTNAAGRLYWDSTQQTLTVGLNANIAADIGQTLYAYATNDESVTINKGQPVYMFAAAGDRVSVKLAYNTGDATSAKTLGVCAENIAAGQAGMILCQGVQDGLNLGAYTAGDTLYLGATAGTLTNIKPYAPNHLVYIGVVERANAGNGRLYVRVQNGYELDELHNVSAQNPSNGQVLIYNASTSLWEKNTLTDGTGITITEGAGSITITNAAPDQTVALTGAGTTSISGTYPNFTITSNDQYVGTVTSVGGTGTVNGISLSGTVTSSGSLTLGGTLSGVSLSTQVTGTLPIANGGTGQTTQTAAFDALAPTTTKGDLIVSNGSDNVRLPVGANNYVLVADSAEATGVKWSAGGSGMSDPGANGVVVRTALNTTTARTIAAGTGISVANGDGVSGNPTITNQGVTSITGTTNQVTASASTGGVTLSLPSTINVNTSGTASNVTGTVAIANGGTGETSRQAAMDALAGAVTSGQYLRGNGTDVVMSAIQAGDVPTLNQNTTGSAGSVTGNATGSTFGFNSGYGSVATAYGCRAWVNFNGTGTVAIRASGNVTSITDNGTGDYTVNFTTAMPDANYVTNVTGTVAASTSVLSSGILDANYSTRALTGSVRINCFQSSTAIDADYRGVAIFR